MSHINYFKPYISKKPSHEDQLTRAFLVVLRYSPSTLMAFYNHIYQYVLKSVNDDGRPIIPSFVDLELKEMKFATQVGKFDSKSETILSVLITDEGFETKDEIVKSERGARYDGVVDLSPDIILIIENKPRSYNVRKEQFNPSQESVPEGAKVIRMPVILEWKEIVKILNQILRLKTTAVPEGMIVEDFLEFVNEEFPFLNPYDKLSLCKGNDELMKRRINNILKDIIKNKEMVEYHYGWQQTILRTGIEEAQMIGMTIKDNKLKVEIWYGDTPNQARQFYGDHIPFQRIEGLKNKGFLIKTGFHISHVQRGLVWLDTSEEEIPHYYEYWINNKGNIKQRTRDQLRDFIDELSQKNLIKIKSETELEIKKQILDTKRKNLNVCPSLGVIYEYPMEEAIALDEKKQLAVDIKTKIADGLGVLQKKIEIFR